MIYQSFIVIGKWRAVLGAFLLVTFLVTLSFAQGRTGEDMMVAADQRNNLFKDITLTYRMTVKVSSGENRVMEFTLKQKGNQLRLIKFTSPDTLKGMAYLTTGPGVLFGLLPGEGATATQLGQSAASQTI